MKASDTVMDKDEMLVCSLVSRYPFKDLVDVIKETCEHQAEVSFLAGVDEGWRKAEAHYHIDTG